MYLNCSAILVLIIILIYYINFSGHFLLPIQVIEMYLFPCLLISASIDIQLLAP